MTFSTVVLVVTAGQENKAVLGHGDEVGGEVGGEVVRALQNGAQGVEKGRAGGDNEGAAPNPV